jgi:hypothetical protein
VPIFETDPPANPLNNMADMVERLGIGRVATGRPADERILVAAIRACEGCLAGEVCGDWLRRASTILRAPPSFCPNAGRFAQLLATK